MMEDFRDAAVGQWLQDQSDPNSAAVRQFEAYLLQVCQRWRNIGQGLTIERRVELLRRIKAELDV